MEWSISRYNCNLDFWKVMKLLFLLLLCVLIPIASFVERGLFIKTFCHRKYLNRRIVYSSGHQATFNPAVITNKGLHMIHGNINTNEEASHTTSNAKKRSLKFLITFPNKMENLLYLASKLCIILATFFWICSIIELFPVTFSCNIVFKILV